VRDTKCPNCSTEMTPLGCCLTTGFPVHWCVKCGAIMPCDHEVIAPADAERRQSFSDQKPTKLPLS
jgi:hypothetical protein